MNLQSKDCFRLEGVVTGVFRVKARTLAVAIGGTWPPVLIIKWGFRRGTGKGNGDPKLGFNTEGIRARSRHSLLDGCLLSGYLKVVLKKNLLFEGTKCPSATKILILLQVAASPSWLTVLIWEGAGAGVLQV